MQHTFEEIIRVDPKSHMSSTAANMVAARHGMDTLWMAVSKAFEELCMCWWKSDDLRPSTKHADLVLMRRHHHALAPPLGHTPTLASSSALCHRSLPS
jgi:hypothetical protein